MEATSPQNLSRPQILAPAGDEDCFLAALAAGADAIYLGLKQFSARMEAENFGLAQLSRLVSLAHAHDRKVFVAMNTLIKPGELIHAWRMVRRLATQVEADGLIIQDLALVALARQANFRNSLAFSTLANVTFPAGLTQAARMGANRVILPRELSLDEMRLMGNACPESLSLECFVQGALCYCVSGRCYWSSFLGGKSGLRGRCTQPCRRKYTLLEGEKTASARFFACQDLEIGQIAKTLLTIPQLDCWKIEGRKKGPHYVFHTVTAYRLLRDNPGDSATKKLAQQILEQALGRPGVKANFLSQRPVQPMRPDGQTSSGLLAGKITFNQKGECLIRPRLDLLPLDYLRIGVEDEPWHATLPVRKGVPKGGSLALKLERHKTPKTGTPVYLIDRREPDLRQILANWREELEKLPLPVLKDVKGSPTLPRGPKRGNVPDMRVSWTQDHKARWTGNLARGLWLAPQCANIPAKALAGIFFWLPPVIWPNGQNEITALLATLWHKGARLFVCNAPWQRAFFPKSLPSGSLLVAGPFCNTANGLALEELAKTDFGAAFASPELSGEDLKELPRQSPLPLGLILEGFFPAGISRFGLSDPQEKTGFSSPKGEIFWSASHNGDTWIYPGWKLDLREKRKELEKAGYSFFASLVETPPKNLPMKPRQSLFNWNGTLL